MTKYIHILNFKTDEVASEEEAREVGVRLMIQNIKHTSKYILVCVTDEPIDPRDDYKLKLAYSEEELNKEKEIARLQKDIQSAGDRRDWDGLDDAERRLEELRGTNGLTT